MGRKMVILNQTNINEQIYSAASQYLHQNVLDCLLFVKPKLLPHDYIKKFLKNFLIAFQMFADEKAIITEIYSD